MNYSSNLKIIVYVPVDEADNLRDAMHKAGAGNIGDYSHCSWSARGKGRFKPGKDADPTIGEVGKPEIVDEERVEMLCPREKLDHVIKVMKRTHSYEEVAYDVFERVDV